MKQDRIDALRQMARRGTPNEARQAKTLLERDGIPLEPPTSEEDVTVELNYRTAFEKELIIQTYFSIFRDRERLSYYKTRRKKTLEIIVPKSHAKLLIEKALKILDDWRKQLKLFKIAFIEKNNLYSDIPPQETPKNDRLSREDMERIISMMSGISQTKIDRLLKGLNLK